MDESLVAKMEHEISRIDKSLSDVRPLLNLCTIKEKPDIVEITAAAQVLHSFYNGVESIIVLIFKTIGERLPNDYKWHKTLFEMAFGENSRSIKLLDDSIKKKLGNYLSFRHFVRHSYSSELDWKIMGPLIIEIEEIWKAIKINFNKFMEEN